MKFLLVGNGAREHAIAERIVQDSEFYAIMSKKNPGIARLCKKYWICDIENPQEVVTAVAQEHAISPFDIAFVSPDAALAAGVSDALGALGIKIASPSKAAARIEWDKGYMRSLMDHYKIEGSLKYRIVRSEKEAISTMKEYGEVVLKPLGLTGGKGVKVSGDHFKTISQGMEYVRLLLTKDGLLLIEEKAIGEEFSLQCFSDGTHISLMPPVQDHKRALTGDNGVNTGGMGSYSSGKLLPFLKQADIDQAARILESVIAGLKSDGCEFRGILYGQFMAVKDGVRVIEFNARFGDPEAMNVLSVIEGSLSRTLQSISNGQLVPPKFSEYCTVVKYLVPEGYPDKSIKDVEVDPDETAIAKLGARLYYAAVYEKEGKIMLTSSRAFGVLGKGSTLEQAEQIAETACAQVVGPLWHRQDIGTNLLIDKKVKKMEEIRK